MTATVISGINLCPRHRVRCCCAAERKSLNAGEQAFKESRRLITVGGKAYDIRFFASAVVLATDELVFHPNDATPEAILELLKASAIIYEPPETQDDLQLIALSTCQTADTLDRMVVFGVMKESF